MALPPPPGYTGPTAPYNVLSPYGGIDPNFISQGVSEYVAQNANLPFGLGQYLQVNNPNQLAGALNYSMGQVAQPAINALVGSSTGVNPYTQTGAAGLANLASGASLAPYQQNLNWLAGSAVQGLSPFLQGNVGDVATSPTMKAAMDAWEQNVKTQVQQQMQLAGLGRSAATAGAVGESATNAMLPILQNEFANRLAATGQIPGLSNAMTNWAGLGQQGQLQGSQALGQLGLGVTGAQQAGGQALGNMGLSIAQMQQQGAQNAAQMLQQGGFQSVDALQKGLGLEQQAAVNAANIANQEQMRGMQGAQGAANALLGLSNPLLGMGQYYQTGQMNALQAAGQAGELQRSVAQQAQDAAYQDFLRRQGLAETSSTGLFGGATLPAALNQTSKTTGGK